MLNRYMYKDIHCYFTTAFSVSFNGPMRHLDAQTRNQIWRQFLSSRTETGNQNPLRRFKSIITRASCSVSVGGAPSVWHPVVLQLTQQIFICCI